MIEGNKYLILKHNMTQWGTPLLVTTAVRCSLWLVNRSTQNRNTLNHLSFFAAWQLEASGPSISIQFYICSIKSQQQMFQALAFYRFSAGFRSGDWWGHTLAETQPKTWFHTMLDYENGVLWGHTPNIYLLERWDPVGHRKISIHYGVVYYHWLWSQLPLDH